jgi:multidrug efflux pump
MWYFGITMNIFSQIGIIMLIGLVSKNGILIVEFANQRKEAGMNKFDAIAFASAARLRPILMTSFSTILGILPLAIGMGEGAQSRVAMGIAVVGGLVISTFLTLYVVPSIYLFISSETKIKTDELSRSEKIELYEN